ncbi:MAG: sortase [Actinomycetota bacterium]|nr:sortase [Actinomycetota bacterium]
MFLRTGVILMSLALVLVAATVVFAGARDEYEQAASVRPLPPPAPEPVSQTVEEREDYSQPWLNIPDPKPQKKPGTKPESRSEPRKPQPGPTPKRVPKPEPKPELKPTPEPRQAEKQAPVAETKEWQAREKEKPKPSRTRSYNLPAWAKMGLTVPSLGIQDAPVRSSNRQAALDAGVVHLPETSLPGDEGPQGNVYLAGHRLGWPGTGSHRIFYRLPELSRGDEVVLRSSRGRAYRYRVMEKFLVGPEAT